MSDSLQPCKLQPTRLLCPWDSLGKNTGVGCYTLLQRIFLVQGSNLGLLHLLHWQVGSLPLAPLRSPYMYATTYSNIRNAGVGPICSRSLHFKFFCKQQNVSTERIKLTQTNYILQKNTNLELCVSKSRATLKTSITFIIDSQ